MYQIIIFGLLFLIVMYLLYQTYNIQREIYKIKNSFDELNNFLDLSIKKSKPKVLDTLSSINTTDITDNIVTYSNDVRKMKPEATIESHDQNVDDDQPVESRIQVVQDSDSDDGLGSFNMKIFNNIKSSINTQLSETSEKSSSKSSSKSSHKSSSKSSHKSSKSESQKSDSPKSDSPKAISMSESSPVNVNVVETNVAVVNADAVKVVSSEKSPTKVVSNSESPTKVVSNSESPTKVVSNSESSKSVNELPKHTLDDLNKMTIINIKEIAKQLNILLSVSGKTKNKATLINDILQH